MLMSSLPILASLIGCDRSGLDKVPQPNDAYPAVVEIGQIEVMTGAQYSAMASVGSNASSWCNETSAS